MFNPVYPFTKEVLETTIKRGCIYFVRNYWNPGADPFHPEIKAIILTHYDDKAKAQAHYHATGNDIYRFLYDSADPDHLSKLRTAANQPTGYRIYSAYFIPDYKDKITNRLKEKINLWMYRNTHWNPKKGETVNIDFYLQHGQLYVTLVYAGNQRKVKFEDIETTH